MDILPIEFRPSKKSYTYNSFVNLIFWSTIFFSQKTRILIYLFFLYSSKISTTFKIRQCLRPFSIWIGTWQRTRMWPSRFTNLLALYASWSPSKCMKTLFSRKTREITNAVKSTKTKWLPKSRKTFWLSSISDWMLQRVLISFYRSSF